MKLVYTCHLRIKSEFHTVLSEISDHASRFYNMTLYEQINGNYLHINDYYYMFKDHPRCDYLQKHTYMQAIKQSIKDMKSFNALKRKYKTSRVKVNQPRYKNNNRKLLATFMKTAIRMKDGKLLLSIGKKMKIDKEMKAIVIDLPEQVNHFISGKNIKMITLKKLATSYECRFVYEKSEKVPLESGGVMAIDLGVSNLAALTFGSENNQYLIDGHVLKGKLAYYNKKIAESYSKEMQLTGSRKFRLTHKMKKIMKARKGYVDYYIHKSSRMIIDLALSHGVKTIAIGDFKHIKNENHRKYFVQIPHRDLVHQIMYKGKLEGLSVVMVNESYTSGVSSIDLEEVSKTSYNKNRRVTRGLFKSSYGMINADINGSLNILRKHVGYSYIPRLIKEVRGQGFRENPLRLKIV